VCSIILNKVTQNTNCLMLSLKTISIINRTWALHSGPRVPGRMPGRHGPPGRPTLVLSASRYDAYDWFELLYEKVIAIIQGRRVILFIYRGFLFYRNCVRCNPSDKSSVPHLNVNGPLTQVWNGTTGQFLRFSKFELAESVCAWVYACMFPCVYIFMVNTTFMYIHSSFSFSSFCFWPMPDLHTLLK